MYRITVCSSCSVEDKFEKICQSSGLCWRCYHYKEQQDRIRDSEQSGRTCPSCGSSNYSEGTYYEECHNCGHEQAY